MAEHMTTETPSFLTLPPEIRNQIYDLLFVLQSPYASTPAIAERKDSHSTPSLSDFGKPSPLDKLPLLPCPDSPRALMLTCRKVHSEAKLLYYTRTHFSLSGPYATPDYFSRIIAPLCPTHLSHIRHITLAGRISHLRALNESWDALPFANPHLHLHTLIIIPRRPQSFDVQYAEIADLSQSHTLAYILAETLKRLRNVDRVVVRNDGCFNELVWRLCYRSLVYRMFRWGGNCVGVKFRNDESCEEGWFELLVGKAKPKQGEDWRECGEEIRRLMGDGEDEQPHQDVDTQGAV